MMDWHASLTTDHRETERLLARLQALLEAGDWNAASLVYQQLAADLLRHYALEEQALFPVLSQYRSMILLTVEHDDLLALQQAFADELAASVAHQAPSPRLFESLIAFQEQLAGHILEEDRQIIPLAEEVMDPEEKLKVKRLFSELSATFKTRQPVLLRPQPGFSVSQTGIGQPLEKPVAYHTLYEREHTSIQHVQLQQGQTLARHWAAQHQYLLVLSGAVEFRTDRKTCMLEPGMAVTIDSRLPFSLAALSDSHLLCFKAWPRPHLTKP
jgi:hemerythrin-like domain-containing protein/quercetin dioxygenase-like cupin family protein